MDYWQVWTAMLSALSFFAACGMAGSYFVAKAREKALVIGAERDARTALDICSGLQAKISKLVGDVEGAAGKADAVSESLAALNAKVAARAKADAARDRREEREKPTEVSGGGEPHPWPAPPDVRLAQALVAQGQGSPVPVGNGHRRLVPKRR